MGWAAYWVSSCGWGSQERPVRETLWWEINTWNQVRKRTKPYLRNVRKSIDPTSPSGTRLPLTLTGRGNCRVQTVPEVSSGSWGQLLSTAARCANRGDAHLHVVPAKREKWIRDVKCSVSLS